MKVKFKASELVSVTGKLTSYCKPDNSYVLEITKARGKRSLPQNKYYWGVIITLFSQQTGYTANEAHQELSRIHLNYDKDGKTFVKSTTELNTSEFEDYAEKCRLFMWHELSIQVPLPNEITEEFLIQINNIYNY